MFDVENILNGGEGDKFKATADVVLQTTKAAGRNDGKVNSSACVLQWRGVTQLSFKLSHAIIFQAQSRNYLSSSVTELFWLSTSCWGIGVGVGVGGCVRRVQGE